MKLVLFALALTCVVSANPIVLTDPIPVHGSGWFSWSWPGDGYYQLWFTGSDGVNTVSLTRTTGALITGTFRETMDTWVDTTYNGCCGGWGRINDVVSDRASFSMGRGAGSLTLYDHAGDMLASVPLISSFFITNYAEEIRSGRVDWRAGDIVVTSAPEPGTFTLLGIGLLLGYLITARFMTRPEMICRFGNGRGLGVMTRQAR